MPVRDRLTRQQAARMFHALSDETRLEILERLLEGEQCVCDLTSSLGAAQSRLSFHLKVLKEAGLIADRPEGRWVYYALKEDSVEALKDVLQAMRGRRVKAPSSSLCC